MEAWFLALPVVLQIVIMAILGVIWIGFALACAMLTDIFNPYLK